MNNCPKENVLAAYEAGRLADLQAKPIAKHVHTCNPCRNAMERLRTTSWNSQLIRDVFQETDATMVGSELQTQLIDNIDVQARSTGRTGNPDELRRHWPIPDYERVLLAGKGAYGSVWAVRDRVGVYRALKVIDLIRMRRARIRCRERAALEAYCRRVRRHPHLVSIHHVGEVDEYFYYTMDLADDAISRCSVRDRVPSNYQPLTLEPFVGSRRIATDLVVELIRRLLRGLAVLHDIDLVHRDIKPLNVIFAERQPKLADIGVLSADSADSRPIGTPRYMPRDGATDKTTDIYAIGRVFHELLVGRGASVFPELPPTLLWTSEEWELSGVAAVIKRACADKAADRYPDASMMLDDLENRSRIAFDSLLEELDPDAPPMLDASEQALIKLGFAFIRLVPWLLGFIAVMFLISRLAS